MAERRDLFAVMPNGAEANALICGLADAARAND